jgi:hypothetical protein
MSIKVWWKQREGPWILPSKEEFHRALHHQWWGLFNFPIIRITKHFMEDPYGLNDIIHLQHTYILAYYDWDLDTAIYAHWSIAMFVRFWNYYSTHKYFIERWFAHHGMWLVDDGEYLKTGKFNWNIKNWSWRWTIRGMTKQQMNYRTWMYDVLPREILNCNDCNISYMNMQAVFCALHRTEIENGL